MSNPMNNDVIRAERLGKTYAEGSLHTQVFDGLDIAVAKGETVAILGASGAGKSTLLHLLGGLDVPSAGEVFVAGVGALAKRLDEMSLTNVRIVRHDAVEIVRDMIAENSLDGVHIYFPDPWRKARHHKRRLVAQPFIGRSGA